MVKQAQVEAWNWVFCTLPFYSIRTLPVKKKKLYIYSHLLVKDFKEAGFSYSLYFMTLMTACSNFGACGWDQNWVVFIDMVTSVDRE